MKKFNIIYEENKKIDDIFNKTYNKDDRKYVESNILELLVELGELANETRCFKYWSSKKPSEKEIILDEYADCFLMILYFCNITNVNLEEEFKEIKINDTILQFKHLFNTASCLNYQLNKNLIKELLSGIVNLGKLLNFSTEDIINGCLLKLEKVKERLKTSY